MNSAGHEGPAGSKNSHECQARDSSSTAIASPSNPARTAPVVCTGWKPFERNTLQGFADLHLAAARLNIRGCAVHEKNGKRWIQLPARPQLDKDRQLVRDDAGKIQYWPVMEFDSREVADRFSEAALRAIDTFVFKEDFGA